MSLPPGPCSACSDGCSRPGAAAPCCPHDGCDPRLIDQDTPPCPVHDRSPAMTSAVPAIAPALTSAVDLTCPHCGAKLHIELETQGSAYMHYEVPESIECDGYCEATWEPDGTARDEPKWVRYPGLYEPPS